MNECTFPCNSPQFYFPISLLPLYSRKQHIKFLHLSKVLLTPPDEGPRVKGQRIKLQDIVDGLFLPLHSNGSWISGKCYCCISFQFYNFMYIQNRIAEEFIYLDQWGRISLLNVGNLTDRVLMSNVTYVSITTLRHIIDYHKLFPFQFTSVVTLSYSIYIFTID